MPEFGKKGKIQAQISPCPIIILVYGKNAGMEQSGRGTGIGNHGKNKDYRNKNEWK